MENRSRPAGVVIPTLIYDDVPAAAAWLCRVFGFRLRIRAGDDHAQLAIGSHGGVMLGRSRNETGVEGGPSRFGPPSGRHVSQSLLVAVDDVDEHHRLAAAAGARVVLPPTSHPYGERQYAALDLAGHRWTFSQTIEDVDPARWGAQTFD